MNIKAFLCLAVLLGSYTQAQCSTNITLVVGGPPGTNASLSISTGQVAKVVYAYDQGNGTSPNGASLNVTLGATTFSYPSYSTNHFRDTMLPLTASGPASFSFRSISNSAGWGVGFCTIEVSNPNESFVPSTAVVIPADSGGPVNIILESSVDMITWTAALPGTYGTSTTNRFFRVRAERAPP